MRRTSALVLLAATGSALVSGVGGAVGAAVAPPPPTATSSYTLPSGRSGWYDVATDGSVLAVASSGRDNDLIDLVDLTTGAVRTVPITHASYAPADIGISRDGRYFSYTTDRGLRTSKHHGELTLDPTGVVVDRLTGAVRRYPHYDINITGTDGTRAIVYRGPVRLTTESSQWRAAGVLDLTTGQLSRIPRTPTFRHPANIGPLSRDGALLAFTQAGRCYAMRVATATPVSLGRCGAADSVSLLGDGSRAFVTRRGVVDTATGAVASTALRPDAFTAPTARSAMTDTTAAGELVVTCWPGTGRLTDRRRGTLARRTYLVDPATGVATQLTGGAGVLPWFPIGNFENGGMTRVTADGTELFWASRTQVLRQAATAVGTPAPLPAECLPAQPAAAKAR